MAKGKTARKATAKGKAQATDDTEGRISGADFTAWRASLGLNKQDAARALGISANSIPTYEASGGPRTVALACAALAARLGPYSAEIAEHCARLRQIGNASDQAIRAIAAIKALNEALDA